MEWQRFLLNIGLSGEAAFPAAVLDVRQAIRFLRENADAYKLDATKFVAIGGSAGGNLAAMLGMNVPNGQFLGEEGRTDLQTQPTVALAIDQFGPMNFATMDAQAKENGLSLANHGEAMSPESKYTRLCAPGGGGRTDRTGKSGNLYKPGNDKDSGTTWNA